MQYRCRRILLTRLCPALSGVVLSGLALAAITPAEPAIAGEVEAGVSAVPWGHASPEGDETGFAQFPAGFQSSQRFGLSLREADESLPSDGLFFRTGDGLRIGGQGSYDPGSGDLRAIVALKLDF